MAPAKLVQDEDDSSQTQEEFIKSLRASHAERGTSLDLAPRVNGKYIDLFKLFNIVKARGGYDVVSAEKLAWRKVGTEFNLGQNNAAAYAFALKSVYYKNLAAYEIKHVHGREPPPKEILEEISARGADLLNRTVENFRPQHKEQVNGQDSDGSGDEGRATPKQEKMELDDPSSGGGRTTRGLRQAPPQRVIFQPDTASSRQARPTSSHYQSPQPFSSAAAAQMYNPASNPNSASFNLETYNPREQLPLTLKVVQTPSLNPGLFHDKVRRMRESLAARLGQKTSTAVTHKGIMLPGTGFEGPNIYVRTLLALRSMLPHEQAYALHHLVKISHERGDKYKFEAFPGLVEGLIEKVLEVSSLYYDVKWEISYADNLLPDRMNILDGINGTPDILQRIQALNPLDIFDELEPEEFSRKLSKINEAGLVIRNMVLLEDNARYLADQPPIRDYLVIVLNLPRHSTLIELKHYALDVCEQLTKYWTLQAADPLYQSLLRELESDDRGAILTILRAISRISMNLEESNRLEGIPISVLERIFQWILLEDEELVGACLDFLYQFTAIPDNVASLLSATQAGRLSLPASMAQFVRLLQSRAEEKSFHITVRPAIPMSPAKIVPDVPQDLLEVICKMQEPTRSSEWLKSCFEEDDAADITQIELWQAYQKRFSEYSNPENPLLAAAEFIKNVSTTWAGATAQVVTTTPTPKFIIRGIRPRHVPVDTKGRTYSTCKWKVPGSPPCGRFFMEPKNMWNHIVSLHLRIPHKEDGSFDEHALRPSNVLHPSTYDCYWADCRRFSDQGGTNNPYAVAMHVRVHLPDPARLTATQHKDSKPVERSEEVATIKYQDTLYDEEKHDAAGVPLTSALILRNLARNIPKAAVGLEGGRGGMQGVSGEAWMERLFGPLRPALFHVLTHNRALAKRVGDIIWMLDAARRDV